MRYFSAAAVLSSTFLLAGPLLAGQSGGDNSLESVFARMDRAASSFKGLSADLKKVSHTAVINEDTVDIGTILVKRPKPHQVRLLVKIQQPDPKDVYIEGHKVQIYTPKSATVQEYDLGKNKNLIDQFLLLGFGSTSAELKSAYNIQLVGADSIAGQSAARIALVPKSPDVLAHLLKVELWISDATGIPVQQKFYLPSGDFNLATYTNIKLNPDLPDSVMKLNVSKDVHWEYPQR
ncbi:MAG TPA: outer membrane lipoprotein carrier protein LolA [Bryobacteraceae bacterium]|nr:outer membrane lipoprotein carrier protein LolA [Bryobacteraceae bacterium]